MCLAGGRRRLPALVRIAVPLALLHAGGALAALVPVAGAAWLVGAFALPDGILALRAVRSGAAVRVAAGLAGPLALAGIGPDP